jgi:hypothetical protein
MNKNGGAFSLFPYFMPHNEKVSSEGKYESLAGG